MAKAKRVHVKGYTAKRGSKRVHVKGYMRKK